MEPFCRLTASACALAMPNIDTDQICPARFMKEPRSVGYGPFLLHDLRFDKDGEPDSAHALNQAPGPDGPIRILVTYRNFGGGSSREAAVYALLDYGIRCVIAPSFGVIFASNAVNNGLLPVVLNDGSVTEIVSYLGSGAVVLTVDLAKNVIHAGESKYAFDVEPAWREKLMNGWDDIDMTKALSSEIDRFSRDYEERYPWAVVRGTPT